MWVAASAATHCLREESPEGRDRRLNPLVFAIDRFRNSGGFHRNSYRYFPYSFVKSIMALRFSGFTSSSADAGDMI